MAPTLTARDGVHILTLGDDENRWSPEWLDALDTLLAEVVGNAPTALVTTASGKFFTNGLDLDWLMANSDRWEWYLGRIHHALTTLLTLPVPTVAAINGHAFGAGAMLAMAHDFRVMRADRGFLCLPEVDIRIPFTPGMSALVTGKVSPQTAVEAMTTGRRYGGEDALAAGMVDSIASEADLLDRALAVATPLTGKDPGTLGTIKATMYAHIVAALRGPATLLPAE